MDNPSPNPNPNSYPHPNPNPNSNPHPKPSSNPSPSPSPSPNPNPDQVRRIAWIEYYVSKGDLDKARELGWSGDMSFLGLNDDGTPMDDPEEGGADQAEGGGEAGLAREDSSMHRI